MSARILVVDDEADIRGLLKEILTEEGYDVEAAADAVQARSARAKQSPDLVLLDIWMPEVDGITLLREWSSANITDCPVVMMSGHGTVETAVEATRLGAFDFVEKPLSLAKLLRTVERALEAGKRRRQSDRQRAAQLNVPAAKSRPMRELRKELRELAGHDSPVMLIGEAGSGCEMFARLLHSQSARASAPFVTMTASSIRDADADLQVFGREQAGLLERSEGGTLFIDGIDDLSPLVQRLLLGVLETGRLSRIGQAESTPFTARVLSSAQPGIEGRAGQEGGIRRDLLTHLNRLIVRVPPLRDYAEDIPELLKHAVDRIVDSEGLSFRRFGVAAQNRLRNYPWPDNLRELDNLVRRMLIQGGSEEIGLEEIERELAVQAPPDTPLVKQDLLALPLREAREQFERAYLQQQLLLCNGKVGQLARRVGMERTHLYRKLRSLGVDFRAAVDD